MTPAAARAALTRQLAKHGETVTLRRYGPSSNTDASLRVRIMGYTPEELQSGQVQGERKVVVAEDQLIASGFPLPLRTRADAIIRSVGTPNEVSMVVQSIDDNTRRLGGELIGYELGVTG